MKDKEVFKAINKLGPWYQRFEMNGRYTTDNMLTGDHVWPDIRSLLDGDLTGYKILDIGANSAYYSVMAALEGAEVVAVEPSDLYFKQAMWTKHYFEDKHGKKLSIKFLKKTASELDFSELGWFDYVFAISVLYFIGNQFGGKYSNGALLEQKRVVSEICEVTNKVIVRTRNKKLYSSLPYYTSVFLENEFYMLKKIEAKRPTAMYGRLIKDGDYGW